MTLNDLECVMPVILRYATEFGSFGANYVKVVKAAVAELVHAVTELCYTGTPVSHRVL